MMCEESLESLIRTANVLGATIVCKFDWPLSWPSCWNSQTLICFLNMHEPSCELRWDLLRIIFEAKSHMGGGTNRLPKKQKKCRWCAKSFNYYLVE